MRIMKLRAPWLFVCYLSLATMLLAQEPLKPVRGVFSEAQLLTPALSPVSQVSASVVGSSGASRFYYWVVARYARNVPSQDRPAGNATPSAPTIVQHAPNVLNASNYVRVCWNPLADVSGYDLLRTTQNILPNAAAAIAVATNTPGPCFNDQGAALSSYTVNTYDPQKSPASIRWGRLDFPRILTPQNPATGFCRIFVNDTKLNASGSLGSLDALTANGDDCMPAGGAPGAGICSTQAELTQIINLYVSLTGSDTTGTGTSANPWATIQHAVDAGIPPIVCGRYIINLKDTGTYVGAVNLAGRIFAGGGMDYNFGDTYWPFSNAGTGLTDNTWPYSWVEILGSTSASTSYKIQINADPNLQVPNRAAISTSGAHLTLRGVSLELAGFCAQAEEKSFLNLAGVRFHNCITGVEMGHFSHLHLDQSGTVDDDFTNVVSFINDHAGFIFNYVYGIDLHDKSHMDDQNSQNSGGVTGLQVLIDDSAADNRGTLGIRLQTDSSVDLWSTLVCNLSGAPCIKMENANASFATINATGTTAASVPAIRLIDSNLGDLSGNVVTLTNWARGIQMGTDSVLGLGPPTFSGVTVPYFFVGPEEGYAVHSPTIHGNIATMKDPVAFSATPVFDMRFGGYKKITLTGNVTSSSIANPADGEEITFEICQDGGGAHTFVWPADVNGADTIGATGSKCNVQRFIRDDTASAWYAVAPMQKNQ